MNREEAELIAADAQIDQARAAASELLDGHIADYRTAIAAHDGRDDCAYSGCVSAAMRYVDPNDALPTPQSNALCKVSEVLAVAIARLAQAPAK